MATAIPTITLAGVKVTRPSNVPRSKSGPPAAHARPARIESPATFDCLEQFLDPKFKFLNLLHANNSDWSINCMSAHPGGKIGVSAKFYSEIGLPEMVGATGIEPVTPTMSR